MQERFLVSINQMPVATPHTGNIKTSPCLISWEWKELAFMRLIRTTDEWYEWYMQGEGSYVLYGVKMLHFAWSDIREIVPFFPFVLCVSVCALYNTHAYTVFSAIFPFAWRNLTSARPSEYWIETVRQIYWVNLNKKYKNKIVQLCISIHAKM